MRETPAGSNSGLRPSQGQSRCGKGPSISIYFACKLVSSGYAYPLNIAKFSCIVLREKLHRPGLTTACGLRRAKVAAKSWPFPHSTVTMKTSNKLYCIQRSSYRFRITKNKQVNTCFFIETDCAHLPLVGKTESTILEQHTYTSF